MPRFFPGMPNVQVNTVHKKNKGRTNIHPDTTLKPLNIGYISKAQIFLSTQRNITRKESKVSVWLYTCISQTRQVQEAEGRGSLSVLNMKRYGLIQPTFCFISEPNETQNESFFWRVQNVGVTRGDMQGEEP